VLLGAAALAVIAVSAARADLTIQMKADTLSLTTSLTSDKLRLDMGTQESMIYRGDQQLMWMITPATGSYIEMTQEDLQSAGDQAANMQSQLKQMMKNMTPDQKKQMEEAMKNMPPEQRKAMEKMLQEPAEKPAVPEKVQRTVKPTGEKKTINGFECAEYTVTSSDGMNADVWTANLKTIGIDPKELAALKGFGDFLSTAMPRGGSLDNSMLFRDYEHPGPDDVPGIPILSIVKQEGGKEGRFEIVRIDKGTVAADRFNPPEGLKKAESPFGKAPFSK
jgi:hypothetical protein